MFWICFDLPQNNMGFRNIDPDGPTQYSSFRGNGNWISPSLAAGVCCHSFFHAVSSYLRS